MGTKKTFREELDANERRFAFLARSTGRIRDPLPGVTFPDFTSADIALRCARQHSPNGRFYLTNEGGPWRLRDSLRRAQFDEIVIRPGTLPGALRVRGIAAARMCLSEIKPEVGGIGPKWPVHEQYAALGAYYGGSIGVGIVWC